MGDFMHEWALAESIFNLCNKLAQEKKLSKIEFVSIKVGEIQQIDLEIFDFALKEISKGTILENVKIKYNIHPAILHCNSCDYKWAYKESFDSLSEDEKEAIHFIPETIHVYIHCPNCKSADFEIEEGRGVWVEDIS
jgi:hydrogenase nickel incorporation protein HypA/HybF